MKSSFQNLKTIIKPLKNQITFIHKNHDQTSQLNPNMHLIYTIIIVYQLSWESMLPYSRLHTIFKTKLAARNDTRTTLSHTDHHARHGLGTNNTPNHTSTTASHGSHCTFTTRTTTLCTASITAPTRPPLVHPHEQEHNRTQTRTNDLGWICWGLNCVSILKDQ